MKLPRRTFLHLAAGAAALPTVSRIASAQSYPARPVRIFVGFGSGSAFDILARLIGQSLSERLGQPFVIENRGGVIPENSIRAGLGNVRRNRCILPSDVCPASLARFAHLQLAQVAASA